MKVSGSLLHFMFLWMTVAVTEASEPYDNFLLQLRESIQGLFIEPSSGKFSHLIDTEDIVGLYESFAKFDFHGDFVSSSVRRYFQGFDDNMFVTVWVTNMLLDVVKYGNKPVVSPRQIGLSISAIDKYRDRTAVEKSSVLGFWRQFYNSRLGLYETMSVSLDNMAHRISYVPLETIRTVLNWTGITKLHHIAKEFEDHIKFYDIKGHIPADFDDTFANVGLGAQLAELQSVFPDQYKQWVDDNPNLHTVIHALKKYAYRPFSPDRNANTVEPRSYFYLRHFLQEAQAAAKDVAIVNTWVMDIDEILEEGGNVTPCNSNTVDVVVAANVVNGVTAAVLRGVLSPALLDDPDLEKIILNTTSLIAEQIRTGFASRPDLALPYYPSRFMFYWFVSRTLFILNNQLLESPLPHAVLHTIRDVLGTALSHTVTEIILESRKFEGDEIYFDDFLGNADYDMFGRTIETAEDRIFTTSMAVNALLHTWTVFNEDTKKISWHKNAPAEVKSTVKKSTSWLVTNTFSGKYKPWNVIFSGEEKGYESFVHKFPINRLEYLDGRKVENYTNDASQRVVLGFEGVVPEEEYLRMCEKNVLGEKTPMTFSGYDADNFPMTIWVSEPFTYASVMLAVSMYDNIDQ